MTITPELTANYNVSAPKRCDVFLSVKVSNPEASINFFLQGHGAFDFLEEIVHNQHFDKIVKVNLIAIMFPFIREAIAEITRKTGIPPILLPPVNFITMYKEIEAAKAAKALEELPEGSAK